MLLIFERGYFIIFIFVIIILVENGLKTAILSLIAIISGISIHHPAKCVRATAKS